mgnify:CR=1 FL=1
MEYLMIGFCRWIVDTWFDYIQVLIVISAVTPSGVDVLKFKSKCKCKFRLQYRLQRAWTSLES